MPRDAPTKKTEDGDAISIAGHFRHPRHTRDIPSMSRPVLPLKLLRQKAIDSAAKTNSNAFGSTTDAKTNDNALTPTFKLLHELPTLLQEYRYSFIALPFGLPFSPLELFHRNPPKNATCPTYEADATLDCPNDPDPASDERSPRRTASLRGDDLYKSTSGPTAVVSLRGRLPHRSPCSQRDERRPHSGERCPSKQATSAILRK